MKEGIDKMLEAGVIPPIEESVWADGGCKAEGWPFLDLDFCTLNEVCVIVPFPTLFMEDILEGGVGCEAHTLTDGFSGHHQVQSGSQIRPQGFVYKPIINHCGVALHTTCCCLGLGMHNSCSRGSWEQRSRI